MIIRPVTEDDIPEIGRWFETRRWEFPPIEDIIPKDGLVADNNGVLVSCAFLYLTGRSVAFIAWTATNPDVPERVGMIGLNDVIEKLKKFAAQSEPPVRALCTYVANEKLIHHYTKNLGFRINSKIPRQTQLIWTKKDENKTV